MMPTMLRHPMRRMLSVLHLRGWGPMMDHRLHSFAVLDLCVVRQRGARVEVVADTITRKNLRRYQPRADVSVMVAEGELVKPGLASDPVFARRDQNRAARRSGRAAKDERMHTLAINDFDKRQLAGAFFDDDSRKSATCGEKGEKRNGEKFGTHKRLNNGVVAISNPSRQQFLLNSINQRPLGKVNRILKIFERARASANEAK